MIQRIFKRRIAVCVVAMALTALSLTVAVRVRSVSAAGSFFMPGNLVVSRSVYGGKPNTVTVGSQLPPNCVSPNCVTALYDGTYPTVFNDALIDGSFGITSKIFLDQMTTAGALVNTLAIDDSHMVTSFSSKSEIALNLSLDGNFVTFMGYATKINNVDVSNSNTPLVVDPTNPVPESVYRVVATVDASGDVQYTLTNAYSGNNGRAAIWNNTNGANVVYTSGNAGNGGNPQPVGVLLAGGTQILTPSSKNTGSSAPGLPTPVGSFNITQLGDKSDKIGKDNNFRGLTVFNNVVYLTKGSGGNGVNTVYFIDTTTSGGDTGVCNDTHGVGLPAAGATLPTSPLAYDPAILNAMPSGGLDPNNMCILKGFPTALKSTTSFPFGIWFANANTLYVADEGDGTIADAGTSATAGLQKWIYGTPVAGQWNLAYTLQKGLGLGKTYVVDGYPIGINEATGLPWAPAPDGLRNITGQVSADGTTATIWAITSTVSGSGDQGADPNQLVTITDTIAATTKPAAESFTLLRTANSGEVLRGISFTPGTN